MLRRFQDLVRAARSRAISLRTATGDHQNADLRESGSVNAQQIIKRGRRVRATVNRSWFDGR